LDRDHGGEEYFLGLRCYLFLFSNHYYLLSSDVKADTLTSKRVSNVFFQRFFVRGVFRKKI
jgi:hypothetical protein